MKNEEQTYSPEDEMISRIDAQLLVRKAVTARVGKMMEMLAAGFTQTEIADTFNITQVRVGQLLRKEFRRINNLKRKTL